MTVKGSFKNRIGETFITNEGYNGKILESQGIYNYTIQLDDERKTILFNIRYDSIVKGKIKNPNHRSVFGVGYLGVGKYKSKNNGKETKAYSKWRSILERSCCFKYKNKWPAYKNVTLVKEWECFQDFAEWFYSKYNSVYMNNWHLDKDILVKGNKIYSPETCCLVPREINNLFTKSNNRRGELPIGVSFCNTSKKFKISSNIKGKKKTFNTKEETFQAYKTAKEAWIKEVADKWREKISEECYQAMYNYKVEITD